MIHYTSSLSLYTRAQDEQVKAKHNLKTQQTKQRRRMLGNIRFIGELFKLGMLTENIMHSCVKVLLQKNTEEALECLCRLLSTIGSQLDPKSNQQRSGKVAFFLDTFIYVESY